MNKLFIHSFQPNFNVRQQVHSCHTSRLFTEICSFGEKIYTRLEIFIQFVVGVMRSLCSIENNVSFK